MKGKKYRKVRDHCHYKGEYKGGAHSICNLKYSVPKKIQTAFHSGFKYDYLFIIKELAEEFKKQFTCLVENTEKYITFIVLIEKDVTRIDRNEEEITKKLLVAQDLWQAHYQILSIIFLKELINVNADTMIKNVTLAELNINIVNTQPLRMI